MSYPEYPYSSSGYPPYPNTSQEPSYPPYPSEGGNSAPYPFEGGNYAPYPPYPQEFPSPAYPSQPGFVHGSSPYPPQPGYYSNYPACPVQTVQYPYPGPVPDQSSPTDPYCIPEMATHGTVYEYQPFNPEDDAQRLRKAMKGFGTDEKSIIEVLAHRTNYQRQHIALSFKTQFGKDLISDLKSELSGKFEDVIVGLMTPTADYLAHQLHNAISGLGTNDSVLVEIMCSVNNTQMHEIIAAYQRLYKTLLEKDIRGDTSGHFRRILVSLCMGNRDENPATDHGRAVQDAQALYQAGEGCWGTEESVFNRVLVTQSYPQLRLLFEEYHRQTSRSIEQTIKNEFSGDIEESLLAIVKCVKNLPAYFAERLYRSMKGSGTDDATLIRIIVTRCEIDMVEIKQEFQRMFGKTLESFIADDTAGDYKRVLLALVQ